MIGAADIRLKGRQRTAQRAADDRLRAQVKDGVDRKLVDRALDGGILLQRTLDDMYALNRAITDEQALRIPIAQ